MSPAARSKVTVSLWRVKIPAARHAADARGLTGKTVDGADRGASPDRPNGLRDDGAPIWRDAVLVQGDELGFVGEDEHFALGDDGGDVDGVTHRQVAAEFAGRGFDADEEPLVGGKP